MAVDNASDSLAIYLEVCEIKTENGQPIVARINENAIENTVAVYFSVKNEDYFIVVYLTQTPEIEVAFVYTESGHRVYLTATSEILTFDELAAFIKPLSPLDGWSKDDIRLKGPSTFGFSRIRFEPIKSLAYGLGEKLDLLLTELEKDVEGVRNLSKNSKAFIAVCRYQYVSGNAGFGFKIETISRMHNLNLGIDIDAYLVGNYINE